MYSSWYNTCPFQSVLSFPRPIPALPISRVSYQAPAFQRWRCRPGPSELLGWANPAAPMNAASRDGPNRTNHGRFLLLTSAAAKSLPLRKVGDPTRPPLKEFDDCSGFRQMSTILCEKTFLPPLAHVRPLGSGTFSVSISRILLPRIGLG